MKRRIVLIGIVVLLAGLTINAKRKPAERNPGAWTTNYAKALETAKTDGKLVLADFTGSDWCPPCMALWNEVLSTAEFQTWAQARCVLVELEFPKRKRLPPDIEKQNEQLARQFKVGGFPTVIVISSAGKEIGRIVGYGGRAAWKQQLEKILAKAKK